MEGTALWIYQKYLMSHEKGAVKRPILGLGGGGGVHHLHNLHVCTS